MYVDYSEAFLIDFSEIKYAQLISSYKFYHSKASRDLTQIKQEVDTIFQPLDENRKILAKLDLCKEYKTYDGHQGLYVRILGENKKKNYADAEISHDPLKIIADEYRGKTCYDNQNQNIFWKQNKSDIVKICDPKVKIIPSDEGGNLAIEISMEGDKRRFLSLELCNKTIDAVPGVPVGKQKKDMDLSYRIFDMEIAGDEKKKNMTESKTNYWMFAVFGSLSIIIIILSLISGLVYRKNKARKERVKSVPQWWS